MPVDVLTFIVSMIKSVKICRFVLDVKCRPMIDVIYNPFMQVLV